MSEWIVHNNSAIWRQTAYQLQQNVSIKIIRLQSNSAITAFFPSITGLNGSYEQVISIQKNDKLLPLHLKHIVSISS